MLFSVALCHILTHFLALHNSTALRSQCVAFFFALYIYWPDFCLYFPNEFHAFRRVAGISFVPGVQYNKFVYIERVSSIHSTTRTRRVSTTNAHHANEEIEAREFLRSLYFEQEKIRLVLICVLQCVDETYSAQKTTRPRRWRQKQNQHHTEKSIKTLQIAIFAFIAP